MAKVSKVLQLMERGDAAKFKNKSLDEIEIDMENVEEQEEVEDTEIYEMYNEKPGKM